MRRRKERQLWHKAYKHKTLYALWGLEWLCASPWMDGEHDHIRHIIHWFNELCTGNNEKQMFPVFTHTHSHTHTPSLAVAWCEQTTEWVCYELLRLSCWFVSHIMHDAVWQLNTLRICIYDANMPAATILSVETMNMLCYTHSQTHTHIQSFVGMAHAADEEERHWARNREREREQSQHLDLILLLLPVNLVTWTNETTMTKKKETKLGNLFISFFGGLQWHFMHTHTLAMPNGIGN